jgi:hypothetical protein
MHKESLSQRHGAKGAQKRDIAKITEAVFAFKCHGRFGGGLVASGALNSERSAKIVAALGTCLATLAGFALGCYMDSALSLEGFGAVLTVVAAGLLIYLADRVVGWVCRKELEDIKVFSKSMDETFSTGNWEAYDHDASSFKNWQFVSNYITCHYEGQKPLPEAQPATTSTSNHLYQGQQPLPAASAQPAPPPLPAAACPLVEQDGGDEPQPQPQPQP